MSDRTGRRPVLVVTGAGGMGLAIVRRIGVGRSVVLADHDSARLDRAVLRLDTEGHQVRGVRVDVADEDSVAALAQTASRVGRVEVVVHTAGVSPVSATAEEILRVDLLGTAHVIDWFLGVAEPGTSLLCIASMAGHLAALAPETERHLATALSGVVLESPALHHRSVDPATAYMIAKRGCQLRVQAAAVRWGERGARVNSVSPGVVATAMGREELAGEHGAAARDLVKMSPAQRLGTAEDVAAVAAFLTDPASSYITGTDVLVDGGVVGAVRWPIQAAP